MEDARIVELYWERDEAAIAESSAKYGGYCYQIAFRILALREDAEECVGDTWLRAWEALAESLNRFLESLPQEKRVLFVRRYWYLCSVEELAAWSGRRRGTVSAALFRLRQDLQEHLEREGFTL